MSYRDNNFTRLKTLINNPQDYIQKILPFLKSKTLPHYRRLLESFGIYQLSKPFSSHEAFLPYVNFKNGFFVQCGGMDGYGNDPTYYLERVLGWNGIIAEPLPISSLCTFNRPGSKVYNYATGSFDDNKKLVQFVDCLAMSFVKGGIDNEDEWIEKGEKSQNITAKIIEVTMRPVQSLIDEYFTKHRKREIDLLVIDTEGYELNVLRGLDFNKNKPRLILIEITKDRFEKTQKVLSSHDYILIDKFNNDYLFKLIN